MQVKVIHNGHRIIVEHYIDSLKLIVDDIRYSEVRGLKNANKDNVLTAIIRNTDGTTDDVRVEYYDAKLLKLTGKLVFYYNGQLIAEKKTM